MHSLWVKLFGYVVHPSIPKDSPDLRVADVGSGTGYARLLMIALWSHLFALCTD